MTRPLRLLLVALLLGLPACGGGSGAVALVVDPLRTTEEMRESCVATTLDLALRVLDLAGPAGDADQLAGLAAEAGCGLIELDETTWVLVCQDVFVRGDVVTIRVDLTYPGDAGGLVVRADVTGVGLVAGGLLTVVEDPELGLVVDGTVTLAGFDGCRVEATLDGVTAFPVADLPGVPRGVLITSGRVDLSVVSPEGAALTGSAAMVGRSAVVSLELDGVSSQGQVALGPQ